MMHAHSIRPHKLRRIKLLTAYTFATHHLTLGVEALDPYSTTQVNGIHTIARRMDNESKNPQVST